MKYIMRILALSCALIAMIGSACAAQAELLAALEYSERAVADAITNDWTAAWEVLDIANADRARAGLAALELDAQLCAAAQVRLDEITREFSHTRPDGTRFATVCEGAYAENIARGQRSATRVMAAWMSSQGHRANILNPRYASIGICACEVDGVMYWVQLFGR